MMDILRSLCFLNKAGFFMQAHYFISSDVYDFISNLIISSSWSVHAPLRGQAGHAVNIWWPRFRPKKYVYVFHNLFWSISTWNHPIPYILVLYSWNWRCDVTIYVFLILYFHPTKPHKFWTESLRFMGCGPLRPHFQQAWTKNGGTLMGKRICKQLTN